MSDEIRPEVIKKTQSSLGKYIKKPPLTEKLLRKPPFRFLHDIIAAVIKETGFLGNLFSEEELNPDIRDKEAKIAFLTKLIAVVKLVTGSELAVRPAKIVSGQEPTKTNELLQAIAKALDKNINSTEAVQHYKTTVEKDLRNSPPSPKHDLLKAGESRRATHGRKATERNESNKESTKAGHGGRTSRKQSDKHEETVQNKDAGSNGKNLQTKKAKTPTELKLQTKASANVLNKTKVRTRRGSEARIKQSSETQNDNLHDQVQSTSETALGTEEKSESIVKQNIVTDNTVATDTHSEEVKNNDELPKNEKTTNAKEDILPVSQDAEVLENSTENTKSIPGRVSDQPPQVLTHTLRPVSGRPSSARPAAPKLRWKPEFSVKSNEIARMEHATVIVEHFESKDDDNESMVVVETETNDYSTTNDDAENFSGDLTQEHGYLVAQILETQKELANTKNVDFTPNKIDEELSGASTKYKESVIKEVDKLRSTIQALTRATNPMGKLLDFWQEDVESMQKELLEWRNQYRLLHNQLELEKQASHESVKPMDESLNEIKAAIKDQLDKIYQTKLNIMKNNHKIQQLLEGRA